MSTFCSGCGFTLSSTDTLPSSGMCDDCFGELVGTYPDELSAQVYTILEGAPEGLLTVEMIRALASTPVVAAPTRTKPSRSSAPTKTKKSSPSPPPVPFTPDTDLSPLPFPNTSEVTLNQPYAGKVIPHAERLAAACAFPEVGTKLESLTLVTAGNTLPNVAAARDAWVDAIGEPTPEETKRFLRLLRIEEPAGPSMPSYLRTEPWKVGDVITEKDVDVVTSALEGFLADVHSYGSVEMSRSFIRPETKVKFSKYAYSYYRSPDLTMVLLGCLMALSLPQARQAAGLLAVDVEGTKPTKPKAKARSSAAARRRR